MSRRAKWSKPKIENGCAQIQFSSWKRFFEYLNEEMHNSRSYIWRGQRCDNWPLKSTYHRLIEKLDLKRTKNWKNWAYKQPQLLRFQYASRGRRGPNPPEIEKNIEWWALGQHHGLATPLLDWTSSPFVATFFAFAEGVGEDQTNNRAIYALNEEHVTDMNETLFEEAVGKKGLNEDTKTREARIEAGTKAKMSTLEFIEPNTDEIKSLISQSGLFTLTPDDSPLEAWVQKLFAGEQRSILLKLLVPNKDRKECLRALNRMNINHASLFPDLYGASKYCNLFAEIENY